MKILLLVILYSFEWGQAFSGTQNVPAVQKIVSSSEAAAIILWERNRALTYPEPGNNEAHLYEIDLIKKSMVEIEIPSIEFKKPDNKTVEPTASSNRLKP